MPSLEELFISICAEVEKELKKVLKGLLSGPMVKGYLPQSWVFKTEIETITFHVDKKGNASVISGMGEEPDVTVSIDHEYLAAALTTREKPGFECKNLDIKFHTGKGQTAFGFLRKRLGL
ncbi:MAG: hypothetical protein Q7J68_07245 [Thermoplasmata archaeon]|nr:hypothetical protein [Thermoplasmata archaeon]